MRRLSPLFVTCLATTLSCDAAFAAAFQFYELGTPVIGTAAVGQAAVTSDASTAYFNPAGMTELDGSQYMLGGQMVLPTMFFEESAGTTFSGSMRGNVSSLIPGVGIYVVSAISEQLKFGLSLTSPYGGLVSYNDGWEGRYSVQGAEFYTINLNPSLAYAFTPCFSVAAGFAVEYVNLHETSALPTDDPSTDGQINIRVSDYSPGFNLALLYKPFDATKIGVAYRSQIVHDMTGTLSFLKIPNTPSVTTDMTMPQNVIASLVQGLGCDFNLLLEAGWAHWSSMKTSDLIVDGYSLTTKLDWKDTYRVGLGGQYQATPAIMVQGGVSYDSSPTDAHRRLPDIPVDQQYRAGLGLVGDVGQNVQVGFSYEFVNLGRAAIENTSFLGVLDGHYPKNFMNVFQTSINVGF